MEAVGIRWMTEKDQAKTPKGCTSKYIPMPNVAIQYFCLGTYLL